MDKWILASKSPRRSEILKDAGIDFEVLSIETPEIIDPSLSLDEALLAVAKEKGDAIAEKYPKRIVLSADTMVVHGNRKLGKPKDRKEAFAMLKELSGKEHQVKTAVVLQKNKKSKCEVVTTGVLFDELSDERINAYLDRNTYLDKAGSYGIQETDFVRSISGSYTSVVGLPKELILQWKKELEEKDPRHQQS